MHNKKLRRDLHRVELFAYEFASTLTLITGKLETKKWENAMTIDRQSWGFRREANLKDYLSIQELIKQLVTTVR